MISVFGSKTGQEELDEISESIQNSWLGFGPKVEKFEKSFTEKRRLNNFLMVDSGSNALYLALTLLDLPKGSEVILPSFTWVSCAHAVLLAGLKPVFCDVDLKTQNVTADTISSHLGSQTGAIMVVHYAGKPVDLAPIKELGFPIIEDAAHAVDSEYRDQPCGGIGDIGVFSFDPVKNLTTGGGGGLSFRNEAHLERARKLRYCGIGKSGFQASQSTSSPLRWWEYDISEIFIKMLPSDISAGIGLAQLKKLDSFQLHRAKIWKIYQDELKNVNWITQPANEEANERHSYFTYFIRAPKRDQLAHYLLEKGIYTTLRYHPLHLNPIFQPYQGNSKAGPLFLVNSEKLNQTGLNIPIHPRLSLDELEFIISNLKSFDPGRKSSKV